MDSNYQWQKQRANERFAARMSEAQIHRQLKQDSADYAGRDQSSSASWFSRLWTRLFAAEPTRDGSRPLAGV